MTDDHGQAAIADFWDERASLEEQAGTRDLIAKELEVEAIAKYVKDGMRVLDVGCGNGLTAIELAKRYKIDITAIDSSEKMINAAVERANTLDMLGEVTFRIVNVLAMGTRLGQFDLVYTERMLVNLPKQMVRNAAMVELCKLLKPRGLYMMCENSEEGLDEINRLRARLDLPEIVPPWHNHYLDQADIDGFARAVMPWYGRRCGRTPGVVLESVYDYSSTYYFLSRVVNAALAAQEGKEPDYDSPINRLALKLPSMGDLGQGKIWLWRRL